MTDKKGLLLRRLQRLQRFCNCGAPSALIDSERLLIESSLSEISSEELQEVMQVFRLADVGSERPCASRR